MNSEIEICAKHRLVIRMLIGNFSRCSVQSIAADGSYEDIFTQGIYRSNVSIYFFIRNEWCESEMLIAEYCCSAPKEIEFIYGCVRPECSPAELNIQNLAAQA